MNPSLPAILDALAARAEREGPQPIPAPLLRQIATALADLAYVGQHGEAWAQRIAREGRAVAPAPGGTP